MCGISAIIGKVEDNEKKLKTSLSKITHRGEYNFEYHVFDNIALGANRLAIVDEKLGKQPQQNEDRTVFAVQNGEIFNYKELTKKLISLGHKFKSNSDTEVLVHLWEEYKEKMVFKLDSEMFSFIIFDKKDNQIFVARDPFGVKPLFYAFDKDKNIFFASEIKALVCFEELKEIHEFPAGHYFYKNEFVEYFSLKTENIKDMDEKELQKALEDSVFKRVQTELPVAVFLSGGVDSSLTMELATRFHNNVTALILGEENSPDYINAIKICKEKNWKYKTTKPEIDYEKELADIIYFVESYDPDMIRHSLANDQISKFAHKLGFKIVLTGEGSDEIFAGYSEFLEIDKSKINLACKLLLDCMSRGHLRRVDEMAMRYTVETRSPFFDENLVNIAMSIDGSLKVGDYKGKQFTKLILRKIALNYLPERAAFRDKNPFANGAGMDVGINYKLGDGILSEIANKIISDSEFSKIKHDFPDRNFDTKEEVLLFRKYNDFKFDRFIEGRKPLFVKDVLLNI